MSDNKEVVENIESNQESKRVENIKKTLDILYQVFPKTFIKDGDCKPLKVGIFEDLKEKISSDDANNLLSHTKIRQAIRMYTTKLKYLYSIKEGVKRVDLDGNDCGECTLEHQEHAQMSIQEIQNKIKPKKTFKKPTNKANNNFRKKSFNKFSKPRLQKATVEDIKVGNKVLVFSNGKYLKATINQPLKETNVYVLLETGLSIVLPIYRVYLSNKN